MGHRMTADVESRIAQFADLALNQITGPTEKSNRDEKSRAEICLTKNWRCDGQIGFTTIIKSDHNAASGTLSQCIRDRKASDSSAPQPVHLFAEVRFADNITNISRLALTKWTSLDLKLVIHEENIEVVSRCAGANSVFHHRKDS